MTRTRLVGITVAALIATAVGGVATASAGAAGITGAGSTLVAPFAEKWAEGFKAKYGIPVTYSSVGSGTGIADITARTVTFGASDAPLTPAQAAACNSCFQVPWALTGVGLGFHLEGVSKLRLTGPLLAKIYLGQITTWNNAAIKKVNPGVSLPSTAITPVYRSDGSGDTYAFTNYLSVISPEWKAKKGYATSVAFETGTGGKGSAGVSAVIASTNGAIGYIPGSYLLQHGIPAASIQNAAGKYRVPQPSQHRGGGERRQESSGEQRTAHRKSAEERQEGVSDLDVQLCDRAEGDRPAGRNEQVPPIRDGRRPAVRIGSGLRADPQGGVESRHRDGETAGVA